DTHQNISNLTFDAGGFLYFSQGLHCFSQVETPWGVSRGDTAGFWRFDPRLTRLAPFGFPSMTSQNPCGIALDRWGALFVKSNGPHLCFATPGLIPTTHSRELMQFAEVGQTPGKSMGGEVVESAHLPDWVQHHAIIAGYFAREVSAIPLVEEGAGFAASPPVQLVYGGHESFRPVDIRQGPDGAIYIADWFNPIINHYQVSLRHPDRDYTHGRIWKLAAKGRAPVVCPKLETMETAALFEQLRSPEKWPREQARRMLSDYGEPQKVAVSLAAWTAKLGPDEAVALTEAAGVLESFGSVSMDLLNQLQASSEPRVRAVAARIIARAAELIPDAKDRLSKLLTDPHPRPRLEAVVACANRVEPDSLALALTALDAGSDKFVEYSLSQAVFALEKQWLPALQSGGPSFEKPSHLAFVLETYGGETSADLARKALSRKPQSGGFSVADRARLLKVLARLGDSADLDRVFTQAIEQGDASLLIALAEAAEKRRVLPKSPFESLLRDLLLAGPTETRRAAVRLAGLWKTTAFVPEIRAIAFDSSADLPLRSTAMSALSRLVGKEIVAILAPLVSNADSPPDLRRAALEAIVATDAESGASLVSVELRGKDRAATLLPTLLAAPGGPAALAAAFESGTLPDSATAQDILTAMNRLALTDTKLTPLLNRAIGRQSGAPEYDPKRVETVVSAIRAGKGDVKKGAAIFRLAQLACTACHRIGDEGGVIGPSLNGVGAGMPLDQIVESILWPDRQIKEGFQAVAFTTTAGAAITGYIEREGEDIVWYRNTATPWIVPLAKKDIASREAIPTLMPPQLTASLSEEQFLDLVAYLASLKG
ncbi:MAG: HEAT repeat domain-containing protein, partial [Verrucomicrobiales bacterium]|nr:HEAT repeat domain-containing protein [Verrucomicrobiales bacterium]